MERPKSPYPPSAATAVAASARLSGVPPAYFGHSAAARRVIAQIQRAVRAHGPVLLVGPTGAGRETIARVIHHFGGGEAAQVDVVRARSGRTLVGLGAFTYVADLEELPLEEQARLPALVGAGRIVASTRIPPEADDGRKLHAQVARWLAGIRIDVPSLSERLEDLEALALQMLREAPSSNPLGGISSDALDCLRAYSWSAELDELREVITHAARVASGGLIEVRDLPARLWMREAAQGAHKAQRGGPQKLEIATAEKRAIVRALAISRGNRRKAARLLGIGKTTLYRKLREYALIEADEPVT